MATSTTANTRATSPRVSALASGQRYAFRVYAIDPAPYSINSPTSAYCYFVIDTTVPPVKVAEVTPAPRAWPAGNGPALRMA